MSDAAYRGRVASLSSDSPDLASAGQASRRRASDGNGRAGGDASPEDARVADLRVDPLSSVAYATESALVVLVASSATAAHLVFPISLAVALLLVIVVVSYRQTVRAYETSGGAYIVAKDNLGTFPSLVGAAALLVDYVLTVAVSIAAGVFAVTSFAPSLGAHKVALSLACLAVIVFVNLRGVRESGLLSRYRPTASSLRCSLSSGSA